MLTPEMAENIRIKKGLGRGSKLRRLRVKKSITQKQLSEITGIPAKTIQDYEQIMNRIDGAKLNTICSLCLALGCKIGDVLEDASLLEKYNAVK